MCIRDRQTVCAGRVAVLLGLGQLNVQVDVYKRQDNIRYAGDDVVGVAFANKIAQQRIEPV